MKHFKAMTNRDFVLQAVRRMPANASFQTILRELDELLLGESVERALKQNRAGRGMPAEEVSKLLNKWIREVKQAKRTCK